MILYHYSFKGRGLAWANNTMSVISPAWNSLEGQEHSKGWTLIWSPNGDGKMEKINFSKTRGILDFVYLTYEVTVELEFSLDAVKRTDLENSDEESGEYPGLVEGLTADYFDIQLSEAVETADDNLYLVEFEKFQKQNTPAAKYARTEKGKLARKKWRQSPLAVEGAKKRREDKKEQNQHFKAMEKWLKANPDKGFGDIPKELGGK